MRANVFGRRGSQCVLSALRGLQETFRDYINLTVDLTLTVLSDLAVTTSQCVGGVSKQLSYTKKVSSKHFLDRMSRPSDTDCLARPHHVLPFVHRRWKCPG